MSEKIKKHQLASDAAADITVYEEKDQSNYIGVSKTKSNKFIVITSQGTLCSEEWWLDADKPADAFTVFQPRIKDVLYEIDHADDTFFIRTNLNAKNFKIVTCTQTNTDSSNWKDYVAQKLYWNLVIK